MALYFQIFGVCIFIASNDFYEMTLYLRPAELTGSWRVCMDSWDFF